MSDKVQKIRQEIERRIEKYEPDFKTPYDAMYQLLTLLDFIDSLPEENHIEDKSEMVSEDLEEAANQHSKQVFHGLLVEDNITAFKAGAEWKEQKDQEIIELAEDHAMLAGMNKMKEEMMKDAVIAWVNTYESVTNPYDNEVSFITNLSPSKFKNRETVKIIIVEEEQQ